MEGEGGGGGNEISQCMPFCIILIFGLCKKKSSEKIKEDKTKKS